MSVSQRPMSVVGKVIYIQHTVIESKQSTKQNKQKKKNQSRTKNRLIDFQLTSLNEQLID